jgi:uncharacterized membrane protein
LAVVNAGLGVVVALPVLAPLLSMAGADAAASVIYMAYRPLCHQMPQRAYFIGGQQVVYDFDTIAAYTGAKSHTDGRLVHHPIRDAVLGYQVAFCQRLLAIYVAMLWAGLTFSLVRGRLAPMPVGLFAVLSVLPIAVDGFTQLFGLRESTWLLRTVTGGLFGVGTVWLALPRVDEAMSALAGAADKVD